MFHHRFRTFAIAVALGAAAQTAAQNNETSDLTSAVRLAVDRGELLYLYDQAAWLGTDDFRDNYSNLMGQTGGYVVTGDETGIELAFFDKSKTKAIYRATLVDGKLGKRGVPEPGRVDLTPLEKRMLGAKDKALEAFKDAKVGLCAEANPNLAALPPRRADEPIIDIHQHLGYSGRRFMNTCFEMSLRDIPGSGKPEAFFVTHLLDPTPTEIHVFTSIASKVPIMVGTKNKWIWAVEGSRVRTVDKIK